MSSVDSPNARAIATAAATAGECALDEAGVEGSVSIVEAADGGARVTGGG